MSQGENQSMHDQLARWDQVREAGIALSRHITTLTTEHEQSTVSGEIFRTLIPACFQRIWVWTEATFSEVNATLPSLLCRFVALDQAGQIMASIFTCLCNYNTDLRDGHGPDHCPSLHHSKHLPGPTISVGEPVPDHSWYHPHQWK